MPLLRTDPSAFPPAPPADPYDAEVIAAHDWAAFSALDELTDHWARPGWADGNRAYYWMLTFPDSEHPELAALAEHCQQALTPLGLDPVPLDGLHITVARVGTRNNVSPRKLKRIVEEAIPRLPDAFTARAIPLAGSRGAVRFTVAPWAPLIQLHASLLSAPSAPSPHKPTSSFRPHLSIAYNNRARSAEAVVSAASDLRHEAAAQLPVNAVVLVELRRNGRKYEWDVLDTLPFT
ncbi:2'-5' RNA ligase family protein [Streptomyces sp. NPDC050095]|uniref:2'-5' RNA ligase family protein n=1 Tax=unclassified Streptomyces TaxID=2593676 RepID=UPI00341313FB